MKMMAVDFGNVRTGIAVCDPLEMLASPVCVIHQTNMTKLAEEIINLAKIHEVKKIILGYPRNMNGEKSECTEKIEKLAKKISKENFCVEFWDERCTTALAHKLLTDGQIFRKKRKNVIDSMAAILILESYIKFKKTKQNEGQK